MEIKLELHEDFIKKLGQIDGYEDLYAAFWIIGRIKKLENRENGGSIIDLGRKSTHDMRYIDLYNLGYVQALIDLNQPLVYNSQLPITQEFLGKALDALGVNILAKLADVVA